MRKPEPPRKCKICGKLEQRGPFFTTVAKHLRICAECINRYIIKGEQ